MQYQLSIPHLCILRCPCNTRHTPMLHGHQIITCLVITVTENPYFNKLLRYQDISHERCTTSYKIPIYSGYMHDCGFYIWVACYRTPNDEIMTYNTKLQGLCQVQTKMESITLSGLIFQLENIFSYHLLVIIPLLMHISCPGNIRVSRMLHGHQNLVSR